jgi:hypothetical protein
VEAAAAAENSVARPAWLAKYQLENRKSAAGNGENGEESIGGINIGGVSASKRHKRRPAYENRRSVISAFASTYVLACTHGLLPAQAIMAGWQRQHRGKQ